MTYCNFINTFNQNEEDQEQHLAIHPAERCEGCGSKLNFYMLSNMSEIVEIQVGQNSNRIAFKNNLRF